MEQLHQRVIWTFFVSNIAGFIIFVILLNIFLLLLIPEGGYLLYHQAVEKFGGLVPLVKFIFKIKLAFLILIIIWAYIWAKLRYKFFKYELTENAFKSERGVIHKQYATVPYERIQNVDINRGILDRILNLSHLQIQTAGYGGHSGGEASLPGLIPEKAEEIREELIKRSKQTK